MLAPVNVWLTAGLVGQSAGLNRMSKHWLASHTLSKNMISISVKVVDPPNIGQKLTRALTIVDVSKVYHTFAPKDVKKQILEASNDAPRLFPATMVPLVKLSAESHSLFNWFGPLLSVKSS